MPDDSAAMGFLWLIRFLNLWRGLWAAREAGSFKSSLYAAYDTSVGPYHGWLAQQVFYLAANAVPTWEQAEEYLADFDPEGAAGVLRCVASLAPVCERIEASLKENDMWDVRKV